MVCDWNVIGGGPDGGPGGGPDGGPGGGGPLLCGLGVLESSIYS